MANLLFDFIEFNDTAKSLVNLYAAMRLNP